MQEASDDDPYKRRSALRECALKYACKGGSSPLSEAWAGGETRECVHPFVCAAFDLATYGVKLSRVYGALRGKGVDDDEESPTTIDVKPTDTCRHCGATGTLVVSELDAREAVRACHALGLRAYRGSHGPLPRSTGPPAQKNDSRG